MMLQAHAEQIATSAANAAWVGALASTFASVVALSVAVWSAHREEGRRRRLAKDQETAFAFGMVGALEMIKPLIVAAQSAPDEATDRRRFIATVDHSRMIADAALAIQVFEMQMLRDGYLLRGVISALENLSDGPADAAIPNRAVREVVGPVLDNLLQADDRFFARLPSIGQVQGIGDRTRLDGPLT